MSGGFFRGTSAEQDTRFSNKMAKLLKTQKFAPELDQLVDISKVQMDVIKPWIATRVTELLGFEDEVLINFIYGLLDGKDVDGKGIQIQLTGFMEKNTGRFMKELWGLLTSAQSNQSGIPQQFLDAKAEETKKKKEEEQRILSEVRKRVEQEKESDIERHGKSVATENVPKAELASSPQQGGDKKESETPNELHSARNGSPIPRRARSRSPSRTSPRRRHSVSPHRRARLPRVVRSPPRRRRSPVYSRSPPRRRKSPSSRPQQFGRSPIRSRRRSPLPSRSPPRRRLGRSRSPRRRRSPSGSSSASPQKGHKSLSRSPPRATRRSPSRSPRPRPRYRRSPSRSPPRLRTRRRTPSRSPRSRRRSTSKSPPPLRASRRSPSRSPVAPPARARRRSPSRSPPPPLQSHPVAHARRRSGSRSPMLAPPHRSKRRSLSRSPVPRARRSTSGEPVRPNGGLEARREQTRDRFDRAGKRDTHEHHPADKREQEKAGVLDKPDVERGSKVYPDEQESEQVGGRVTLDKAGHAGNISRGGQERSDLERNAKAHTEKSEQEGAVSRGPLGRVDQDRIGPRRSDQERSSFRKQPDTETLKRPRSVSPVRGDLTEGGQHLKKLNDVYPPSTPNYASLEEDKGPGGRKPERSGAHMVFDESPTGKGAGVENVMVSKNLKHLGIVKGEEDGSMSPKSSEDRKESKRRKREEKRLRKEEKRRKREEKQKRREGKRAARAAAKLGGSRCEEKDIDRPAGHDEHDGSDGGERSMDDDVESEQKRLRLENDLRKKALDSLRAKKAESYDKCGC